MDQLKSRGSGLPRADVIIGWFHNCAKGHAQLLARCKGLPRGSICASIDWDQSAAEPGGAAGGPREARGPSGVRGARPASARPQVSVTMRTGERADARGRPLTRVCLSTTNQERKAFQTENNNTGNNLRRHIRKIIQ
ncbi:unnamed protein product [Tetraodon nigroviridis]|uniref:(spotted green pufferfish) hypothetical protein n=1 Tax=Tetraodon nigroviridis TaxID=99883 RepID=Q4S2L8_TETNG|nr:unnamed protein product [Tetraodon nigroviridis]